MAMRLVSMFCGLGLFIAAIAMGGGTAAFLSVPSALIVLGGCFFMSASAHGVGDVCQALCAGFCSSGDANAEHHITVLHTVRTTLCASGAIGFLIGLIQMLQNLSDPTKIGPGMAVALLTMLYSVFLAELLVAPMINRLAIGKAAEQTTASGVGQSAMIAIFVVIGGVSSMALVTYAISIVPT
jgi:flagellar motor component MotA